MLNLVQLEISVFKCFCNQQVMSPDMEDQRVIVKRLNGNNYAVWKFKIELLLKKENLWATVKDPKPEVVNDDWKIANDKAMVQIGLTLEDNQLHHVRRLETAHDYWTVLQRIYERGSL